MYNDTIKVANKIISYDDLFEIFSKMQEKLMYYKKISANEEMKNKAIDYKYQTWTFRDSDSKLTFIVDFKDDTTIRFDNYNSFISVFNIRLEEIKYIRVNFILSYRTSSEGYKSNSYYQHINMTIYENKMQIEVRLSSEDKKIDDVYELIKRKILEAPPKYDKVVEKKTTISTTTAVAIGLIPSLIITTSLLLIPAVRHFFSSGYVIFPLLSFILALAIGGSISATKLDKLYDSIKPEQKYAGYDANKGKSLYKDDIDKYVGTSEILIGKNINNLKNRKEIITYYNKYKKYIPYELGIMLILSIIVLFL